MIILFKIYLKSQIVKMNKKLSNITKKKNNLKNKKF